jgi:cell wall assembly regulator SMI1
LRVAAHFDGFVDRADYVVNLAAIYAWTGETDLALEQLATAVAAKGAFSPPYGVLKLDPRWDPLRGDPRFEKIVADLAPNERSE